MAGVNGQKNGEATAENQAAIRPPDASPVNGVVPPVDHRFKPGQSGNPGGRPKGESITAELRRLLDTKKLKGKALAEAMAQRAYQLAMKGDFRYWNAIVERLDGKVADKVDGEITLRVEYIRAERILR